MKLQLAQLACNSNLAVSRTNKGVYSVSNGEVFLIRREGEPFP
jgi:hypothetical protein